MSENKKNLDEQLMENVSGGNGLLTFGFNDYEQIIEEIDNIYQMEKRNDSLRDMFLNKINWIVGSRIEMLELGEREKINDYISKLAQDFPEWP